MLKVGELTFVAVKNLAERNRAVERREADIIICPLSGKLFGALVTVLTNRAVHEIYQHKYRWDEEGEGRITGIRVTTFVCESLSVNQMEKLVKVVVMGYNESNKPMLSQRST